MAKSIFGSIRVAAICNVAILAAAALGADSSTSSARPGTGKQVDSIGGPTLVTCQVVVATDGNDANPGTVTRPFA
jgi:hypothetical protein